MAFVISWLYSSFRKHEKLLKTGDSIEIIRNDAASAEFTMGFHESGIFGIMIDSDQSGVGRFRFETVKVEHKGNRVAVWPF